jgi:hypothetical protein
VEMLSGNTINPSNVPISVKSCLPVWKIIEMIGYHRASCYTEEAGTHPHRC